MESYVKPDSIAKSKHVANQSFFFGERQKALWNDIRWMHKVKQLRNRMTAINVTSKLEKALVGRSFQAKIKQSRYTYNSDSNKSASFCIIQPIVWLPFFCSVLFSRRRSNMCSMHAICTRWRWIHFHSP